MIILYKPVHLCPLSTLSEFLPFDIFSLGNFAIKIESLPFSIIVIVFLVLLACCWHNFFLSIHINIVIISYSWVVVTEYVINFMVNILHLLY